MARCRNVTRNRLYIEDKARLSHTPERWIFRSSSPARLESKDFNRKGRKENPRKGQRKSASRRRKTNYGARHRPRVNASGASKEFMEPERKPSRSRVTNLKPRALKMRVNSVAISGVSARVSS